jgi:hypothetical protein
MDGSSGCLESRAVINLGIEGHVLQVQAFQIFYAINK